MSQPSADAKAVVRAAEALTTQVRRIADALETPVVRYEVAADDGSTTPATTCSAQHRQFGDGRLCIRAAQHDGDHIDERGYHWSDTMAVYPLADSTVKIGHWLPASEQWAEERQELAGMVGEFVDAQVQHARAAEDRLRCPYCVDRQLIPRPQLVEHIARLHPDVETEGSAADEAACRRMETRTCPRSYNGPCGDRPCARFESDDPAPWLDPAEPPYVGATTTPKAAPADDEEAQRTARRDSLRNLLDRLDRSTVHHYDEAQLLRQHVETEMREADTAREVARLNRAHVQHLAREIDRLTAELEDAEQRATGFLTERDQAQAAIERVRAAVKWARHNHPGLVHVHDRLRAALDGTEQPTTEA